MTMEKPSANSKGVSGFRVSGILMRFTSVLPIFKNQTSNGPDPTVRSVPSCIRTLHFHEVERLLTSDLSIPISRAFRSAATRLLERWMIFMVLELRDSDRSTLLHTQGLSLVCLPPDPTTVGPLCSDLMT
jgi:hypothetical protein